MTNKINPLSTSVAKKAAGEAAARLIKDDMLIGLGTGSTATYFIEALGRRCQEGLKISAVATSLHSAQLAQKNGIPLRNDQEISYLDITVDGADEIDHHKNMIKGGGGALLREKLLAQSSQEMIVVVDESKLVEHLGDFPVPVEIATFAYKSTVKRLESHGHQGTLRLNRDGSLYMTDNGNYIFDIQFPNSIMKPETEHDRLRRITGVLETGLFFNIAGRVVVGYLDGFVKIQA